MPAIDTHTAVASPKGTSPKRSAEREIASTMRDLVASGSIEMTADRFADVRVIADLLPSKTLVYVNHLPRHSLAQTLDGLMRVADAGLEPVPHVAARRVSSRVEVEQFLQAAVSKAGVRKVLLLGGDVATVHGPYGDAASLLRDGLLRDAGVREVGFAGYPEGHPRIAQAALNRALLEKLALAAEQKIQPYVMTQFSFAPARIIEFAADLARRAPSVPVYAGVVGPTNPVTLMRFAQRCGVSASLRALQAQGMNAVRVLTHTDPTEQLSYIAQHTVGRATTMITGIHMFTFGGAEPSARFMHAQLTA
jgi:methylenetetrahydrofolate reductase (NADPH)